MLRLNIDDTADDGIIGSKHVNKVVSFTWVHCELTWHWKWLKKNIIQLHASGTYFPRVTLQQYPIRKLREIEKLN